MIFLKHLLIPGSHKWNAWVRDFSAWNYRKRHAKSFKELKANDLLFSSLELVAPSEQIKELWEREYPGVRVTLRPKSVFSQEVNPCCNPEPHELGSLPCCSGIDFRGYNG